MPPLDGTWKMIRAESDGDPSPDLLPLDVQLELRPPTYLVRFAGEVVDRGTFTLEAGGRLTLLGTHGPNHGRAIPCIYQHVGDRLRICYGLDGILPTAFTTAAGSQRYLATYRRA